MARHTSNQDYKGYNRQNRILLAFCGGLALLALLFVIVVECWASAQRAAPGPAADAGSSGTVSGNGPQTEPAAVSDSSGSDGSAAEPEDNGLHITVAVGGDIMAHVAVSECAYDSATDSYDFTQYFTYAGTWFQDADLAVGNLETTFGGTVNGYPMFSSPDDLADSLKELGFDLLSTANNHCMDFRSDGLRRTIEVLDAAGIDHVGTYASQESFDETMGVVVEEVNGISIAFLDYTYGVNYMTVKESYLVNRYNLTTSDESEAAMKLDTQKLDSELAYARSLGTDLIFVMMHWGTEHQTTQSSYQEELADYLIERGADAVLGGHSHVPQPMEYRTVTDVDGNEATGFVCYSLGNLISDMSKDNTYITAVLNLEITKTEEGTTSITGVSYEPLYLLNPGHDEIDTLVLMDVPAVLEAYESGEEIPYLTDELCTELRASMTTLREIFGDEWPVSSEG
ncbi:MAG: CapA family protein [Clostridiales bacterium]|nr:CapA family protein [Clostridiales bacterium]